MRNSFRQSMAWLHAWSGLVVGWVLFAVFVTGTASYYRPEISRWMRPELAAAAEPDVAALARAAERGAAFLAEHAGDATGWSIGMPRADFPLIELYWRSRPGPPTGHALLDPETGAPAAVRDTRGGDFLYRFHFELSLPPLWGRWVVGACAMVMLVALLSGIVTHRRIFADFFTFRRDKSAQRGWLDAHNVAGVLGLPFHLMITYTGLATLMFLYMPWGMDAAFRGDRQRYFAESGQVLPPADPVGQPGQLPPLGPFVQRAVAEVTEPLDRITVTHPRDAAATVLAIFEEPHGLSHVHPQISFAAATGAIRARSVTPGPAARTQAVMVGLHEAHFAGTALRALFFLSGLLGCATVATGLVLWTVARAPKGRGSRALGLRAVDALNVGTIAGLPGAIACYLVANRLLPVDLADRAVWEMRLFFTGWLLIAATALLRPQERRWTEAFAAVTALYLAVPIADFLFPGRPAIASDAMFLGFDAAMLAVAAVFAYAATCRTRRPLEMRWPIGRPVSTLRNEPLSRSR
ncbi:PepSY-associated TM helix domain-containing protein [Methylobacterium sp. NEAU 140]|uniref:PepSY-associated TM helix domain-containing protein n=1 Tax=Methylobacterium sp. NEAU 140 TaxID=3064945 RepID=UPI002732971F|nr:PepSY-associated TM helix domain-containing protein [Methylobacterium sp. NEAU 140]MDP4027128.1 PepSY-associated TM helix domain-containing protein [Methylobacterium sp. NEAU 140]